ncbi:UDP binding domain-containing protein [Azospirillum sp. TSO22-1]|uniref:UDP binding domain-containing protein n=1 Tax=Azospirillum sp. TSO22-1 TaxID=716789 RepID=UPI000D6126F3|nr:UDP binding domain-containing protein [Azospirillum sp. TSO22-1]PWC55340.1 GDP-mannose dehydrogenase [Azospirillum sp. TSO22-1]
MTASTALPTVGFAGMTHLGLVSASAVCGKGFPTVCYDPDAALVGRLRAGRLPVVEPGLDELVAGNGGRQGFTADVADLGRCDVVYIAPDVPTDEQGRSDLAGIRALIDRVAAALRPDAVMVVLCQVPPGFTRALAVLPPERLYYQVETLVFGIAVQRASEPERYIVGCADPARPLDPRFAAVLGAFGCPVLPMRYESAELAKISINMCLVASIAVANTMAELCEHVGAVWGEIVPSLKLDRRIGPYSYLAPGLGIAGGNLERDLATVQRFAAEHGTDAGVVDAWIANSRHRRDWAARTLRRELLDARPDATVAVLGLAYKENTHSTRNSPSLATIAQLPAATRLRLHDPVVPASAAGRDAAGCADPLACAAGADALAILTPWPAYRALDPKALAVAMAGRLVLDPYAVLDAQAAVAAGLEYHTLGRPPLTARG